MQAASRPINLFPTILSSLLLAGISTVALADTSTAVTPTAATAGAKPAGAATGGKPKTSAQSAEFAAAGAKEEALLKRILALQSKGVGVKPLVTELARIDHMFRHGQAVYANPALDRLSKSITHHEGVLKQKDAPASVQIASNDQYVPVPHSSRAPKGMEVPPPPPGAYLVAPPPAVSWTPAPPEGRPEGSSYDENRPPSIAQNRSSAVNRMVLKMRAAQIPEASIQATVAGLKDGTDSRSEPTVFATLQKELGPYTPAPGALRLERYVVAAKLKYYALHPRRSDPSKLQSMLGAFSAVEQMAKTTDAKDAIKVQALAEQIRALEKVMRIRDVVETPSIASK